MSDIPISAAKKIAEQYDWEQVIVIARNCTTGAEHCTTYGINRAHCGAAAKIGNFLKYKVMGWTKEHAP